MSLAEIRRRIEGDPEDIPGLFSYIGLLERYGQTDPHLVFLVTRSASVLGEACVECAFTRSGNLGRSTKFRENLNSFQCFFENLKEVNPKLYIEVIFRSRRYFATLNLYKIIEENRNLFDMIEHQGTIWRIINAKKISFQDLLRQKDEGYFSYHDESSAIQEFGEKADVRGVEPLIEFLGCRPPSDPYFAYFATTALESLGQIGDPRSFSYVVPLLSSEYYGENLPSHRNVRSQAARTLGLIGDPRATPELLHSIRDPDYQTAASAIRALGNIGDVNVIPTLIPLLSDKGAIASHVAFTFRQLGDPAVIPYLIPLLNKSEITNPDISGGEAASIASALVAIGELGDETHIEYIDDFRFAECASIRRDADTAVGKLRSKS